MNIRPYRHIERRKSKKIKVGNISVGGDAPISVQTMTNTPTTDIDLTLDQIEKCVEAGADIIRVSCPDKNSTTALKQLVRLSPIPIVADIHFHYLRAIEAADAGAACLRINPGNIGQADKIKEVISAAKQNQSSIRIGVNAGSLEKNILDKYIIADSHPIRKSVNYKQAISFIKKEIDEDEFFNTALFATRQLAKRQITWMRSWDNLEIFENKSAHKIKETVKRLVSSL